MAETATIRSYARVKQAKQLSGKQYFKEFKESATGQLNPIMNMQRRRRCGGRRGLGSSRENKGENILITIKTYLTLGLFNSTQLSGSSQQTYQ